MTAAIRPRPITSELAGYAVATRFDALPQKVRVEVARAFLNWVGCVLGGCREDASVAAAATIRRIGAAPGATLIGHGARADVASAAFVNSLAASALSYDDTHLATVTHPTGPVAAALLAHAETTPVSGADFLAALALGIEIQCRLSNVLLLPPAEANLALYVTGLTGPIGAAAALGRLMGLDERRMTWAIGLAATQAAGFRATHGSTAGVVVPAFGARAAVFAADLAAAGIDCASDSLESPRGFVSIFSTGADLGRAVDGLGHDFELLANAYKPYPAGIVAHAAIDACREIADRLPPAAGITAVRLRVHPLAVALTDRRHPATPLEAQVSLQHWAASVLLHGTFGIAALRPEAIADPATATFRDRVELIADTSLARAEARAEVVLTDGTVLASHVPHARGSADRPMTDDELDAKLLGQATRVLAPDQAARLPALLRGLAGARDVGRDVIGALTATETQGEMPCE